ncbi:MAG TPA: SusC/RagA family TonB-linked outer membrane protein [Puia sp.]|jgi:TonB-linked SusC/RagA family outer membrane protein
MNQPKHQNCLPPAFSRWLLLAVVLLGMAVTPVLAQTQKITGKVFDETGHPVNGATVREKGGKRGAATDAEGKFSLVVKPGAVLVVTGVGLESQEIPIGSQSSLDIHMKGKSTALNEVVVTALGIRREKSQLTYSTQQVKGEALAATKETGVLNALAGKVSGVQITSSSGQPGASSRIVIRGSSSLLGNNEALIVLDGVPINNAQNGNAGGVATNTAVGGTSRLSDIDPATIESINVLKGSAASALYGSNAARGVVLITTKSGSFAKKPQVSINSQYSFENPIYPEMQTKYSLGDLLNGVRTYYDGDVMKTSAVWGLDIDSLVKQGIVKYNRNPMKAFFTTGRSYTNTLTVGGGSERSSYFFSYSNLDQTGTVPTTTFKRNALFAKFSNRITDQVSTTLQLGYTLSNNHSTPEGYDLTDPLWTIYTAPATWNPLPYLDSAGNQRVFRPGRNNAYWALYNVYNNSKTSRIIPVLTINYKPTTWLTFTERAGADTYSQQADYYEAPSSALTTVGTITQMSVNYRQFNHDLIGQVQQQFGDFNGSFLLGNNINTEYNQTHQLTGTGTSIIGFDNVTNGSTIVGKEFYTRRRKLGFYGQVNLEYKKFLNLSLTGRYDGSSVLSTKKNFYPYGSASAGFIFSELLKVPAISFGKLRVSYSSVGNDNVTPYSLSTPFTLAAGFPYGGNSGFLQSTTLGNPNLINETTKESEVGLEMNFLHNRIGFEASYFYRHHENLLTQNVPIAPSTGYNSTTLNAADMTNKGVEVLLNISPFKGKDLGWDVTLNYTRIRNNVTKINGNTQQLQIGQTWAFVGKPYGVFYNYGYARDSATHQILIDDGGLPKVSSNNVVIGNLQPDFLAGINNSFYYKNWTLAFFFDYRKGGEILNSDDRYGYFYGTPKVTGNRQDRIVPGILASTKEPNTKPVSAEAYYQRLNMIYEAAMQDGTYLKLRTASIGYKLSPAVMSKTPFSAASLTLTGRNLFIYAPHFTGSDPEVSSYGTSNGAEGTYGNTVPTSRSFNLTLNMVFK